MAEIIMKTAALIAAAGLIPAGIRFVLGPTAADRTTALDALTVITISLIVYIGLFAARVIYLDAAMIYGILSFAGVMAVARYLEGGL